MTAPTPPPPFIIIDDKKTGERIAEISGSLKAVTMFYETVVQQYSDEKSYRILTNVQLVGDNHE